MTPLCELALKYGTDKCPRIKHHYTPVYYEMFGNRREEIRKIVEIGVGTGASLRTWRDFFPNAMVYGADIVPELLFSEERIETLLCNQRTREDLERLVRITGSDVDLFIDDGSHNPDDQLFTCQTIMPLLDERAVYVIEDAWRVGIVEGLGEYDWEKIGFAKRASNDDRLIVVRRKRG